MNNQTSTIISATIAVVTLLAGIIAFLAFQAIIAGGVFVAISLAALLTTAYLRVQNAKKYSHKIPESAHYRYMMKREKAIKDSKREEANDEYLQELDSREGFGIAPESPAEEIEEMKKKEKD